MAGTKHSKENPKKKASFNMSINRIELLNSFFDPSIITNNTDSNLTYELSVDINLDSENSFIIIIVGYVFLSNSKNVFSISVLNEFGIYGVANIKTEFKSEKAFVHLVGLSINHTRGVQSTLIQDTTIKNKYIPPITADRILQQFVRKVL